MSQLAVSLLRKKRSDQRKRTVSRVRQHPLGLAAPPSDESTMIDPVAQTLEQLRQAAVDPQGSPTAEPLANLRWLTSATAAQVSQLLIGLADGIEQGGIAVGNVHRVLRSLPASDQAQAVGDLASAARAAAAGRLYRQLRDQPGPRHRLLSLLASAGDRRSLATFAELMAIDPPREGQAVAQAFAPLWRESTADHEALFPRLLVALQYPSVAPVILDLANFLFLQGRLPDHPVRPRAAQLVELLGHVVERLEGWEETFRREGVSDLAAARQVSDGVALALSLAYTLSCLNQREAMGKLYRMLELPHRSLRVEAAAALARWQETAGIERLAQLAAEPLVRLRVLAYAEELNLLERIDPSFRTAEARAEAELVARLSEPVVFGIPPSRCELIDQRRLYWPGSVEPLDCFLFLYAYRLPSGTLQNVGLVGPGAVCLTCDLTQLTTEDQYAAFAGWQAEHEEIGQLEIDQTAADQAAERTRFRQQLADAGYEQFEPAFLGLFFGQRVWVGSARRGADKVRVVAGPQGCSGYALGDAHRPLTPEIAFAIYKGRQLLSSFNREFH